MFDTHCHLNFKAFKKNLDEVINDAKNNGVKNILIPGTDIETSVKAVEIAAKYDEVYAAVGIHPHHVYEMKTQSAKLKAQNYLGEIEDLLSNEKVVAVGEVGIDRHVYQETKYGDYQLDENLINLQKELLVEQIKLTIKYNKSLILHNREAVGDTLKVLTDNWDEKLRRRTVFHCCEADDRLLEFSQKYGIYIGVDGDVTYDANKQAFIKNVPLESLVLETDSPFLLPEPLKSQKKYPNTPSNIKIIAKFVAGLIKIKYEELVKITYENSRKLFLNSS